MRPVSVSLDCDHCWQPFNIEMLLNLLLNLALHCDKCDSVLVCGFGHCNFLVPGGHQVLGVLAIVAIEVNNDGIITACVLNQAN